MSTTELERTGLASLISENGVAPAEYKSAARAIFDRDGLPHHTNEEYKYTSLKFLAETSWAPAAGSITASDLSGIALASLDHYLLVFVNGVFEAGLSSTFGAGVEFHPLEVAISAGKAEALGSLATTDPDAFVVAAHLGNLRKPEMMSTAALNSANFTSGTFVKVSKDVQVDKPIQILNIATGTNVLTTPRNLIHIESGAKVTILESYATVGDTTALCIPVTEIIVDANANVEHVRLSNENLQSFHVALTEVKQAKDSTYRSYNVVLGNKLTRNDINIFLGGQNTHTRFDGVVALSGDQHADNHTRLDHAFPHCESFEVYKHLLADNSRAVFNGKIFVHQDAQKTDAKQTNNTILLSPTAQVDTKPQLEIFADDVKCTHGCTVGHLREDSLFYMRTRGIPESTARGLLVYAFASEVLSQIDEEEIKGALEGLLFDKLKTGEK